MFVVFVSVPLKAPWVCFRLPFSPLILLAKTVYNGETGTVTLLGKHHKWSWIGIIIYSVSVSSSVCISIVRKKANA